MATRKFKRISVGEVRQMLPTKAGKPPKKTVEQFASTTLKKLFDSGDKIRASAIKAGLIADAPSSLKQDAEHAIKSVVHSGIEQGMSATDMTKAINEVPQVYLYFTFLEGLQESVDSAKTDTPKGPAAPAPGTSKPKDWNRVKNRQRKTTQERVAEPRLPMPTTKKPRTKPVAPKPRQVKAKYPYDPDVIELALQYGRVTVAVDPEDQLELVNEYIDALKKGLVPEELWPQEKYLKKIGYNLRDIRKIREEYLLKGPATTPSGLPLSAPTGISKAQKTAQKERDKRVKELEAARENIGFGSRDPSQRSSGVLSSLMNMVPMGILSGIGGDLDELFSSGKEYAREQEEDRQLKAKLRLEGVDVEAEDAAAAMKENAANLLATTMAQDEEIQRKQEHEDKWKARGAKLGSLFKSSPLQSINQSTNNTQQTILNSTQNTQLANSTVNNQIRPPNLQSVIGPSLRGSNPQRADEIRNQNMRTTNNIVNSAMSIDPAAALTPPPSILSPETSSIESESEVKKDPTVPVLENIESGIEEMVDLLTVIGPSLRGEQPPIAGETGGGIVEGVVDTVGSVGGGIGRGALMSGLGLAAAGTAAAVGVAGAGQALIGEDGVLRGGSGNNFINDAVGGRDWQKEDPKEVEARGKIKLEDINAERVKAGKSPFTAEEYEAIKTKSIPQQPTVAKDVQSVSAPTTPAAKDITPTPAKNAVLQQGIEASQDRATKMAADQAAKASAPAAAPGNTTNNSTINNQSTTSLSMRPQPRNNDSPWNRYQESRYQ